MKKRFLYTALPIAIVSLSMQSCFVAKNYDRPEVIDEPMYRTETTSQDTLSMANLPWKELFNDPILVQHIEKALEQNLDIRIAMENIAAAEAYMKQGKMGYAPTLNIGGDYTHSVNSKNSSTAAMFGGERNRIDQYQATANLSWELDVWGKIRSNKRAFAASYLQTLSAHQAVKTQLISTVSSTYFQLLSLDEQKRITEETIENRKSSLETITALKDAGQVTEVAVKQTEAQLLNAQSLLVDIKNNIKLTENVLSIILAENPNSIQRSSLATQKLNTDLNIGLPIQLLSNRPDVRAAEYGLINAFELTNVSRSNFYPSIKLTANGGFQSIEFDQLFNANSLFANIVGSLTQPLINGRQIRTQHEVSKANQEKAYLNYKKAVLTASKEVSDALYTYQSLSEKQALKQKEYQAYALATEYSEELQINGMANYLEVLTARENALAAQLSLINTELGQLNALVQLYKAVGGGVN
ncbi:efflux transporter outer membrane subunit [Myroides guanonis]|uniref:Efflux transporter, outer membrane factor (OMF) lipoprotein, NodT family n=1 Tax=Myroides guanonis TaxID=1150112 RepID=A0A1I3SYK3_9FLAO|nr:TolC family protein [Myroides guanonis]SFJ63894.1 efflux transporter, outer membrane factor (OMF) lipoprotein, NodT family [Myroides guanonis]